MPTRNSNSRKLPFPKLLVSEYSRRIAHELDENRLEYLETKGQDKVYLAIPVGEEYQPTIPDDADHLTLLSDVEHLEENWLAAVDDTRKLQTYLTDLRIKKTIGGSMVPKEIYDNHRRAIGRHVAYKQLLGAQLKGALKRMQLLVNRQMNRQITEEALGEAGIEFKVIDNLLRIIKSSAKQYGFVIAEADQPIMDIAHTLREKQITAYIEKHGAESLYEAFAKSDSIRDKMQDAKDAQHNRTILGVEEQVAQTWADKLHRLSSKDAQAIKYLIDQLLLKKYNSGGV